MNLRAIYHPTGKNSTDCTEILFGQGARDLFIDAGYGPRKNHHFPSYLMHQVNPYTGDAPRFSLSRNISTGKLAGSPLPELEARREKLAAEK